MAINLSSAAKVSSLQRYKILSSRRYVILRFSVDNKSFTVAITDIRLSKTKKKNIPRAIAMTLCREVGLHSLNDIAK